MCLGAGIASCASGTFGSNDAINSTNLFSIANPSRCSYARDSAVTVFSAIFDTAAIDVANDRPLTSNDQCNI